MPLAAALRHPAALQLFRLHVSLRDAAAAGTANAQFISTDAAWRKWRCGSITDWKNVEIQAVDLRGLVGAPDNQEKRIEL